MKFRELKPGNIFRSRSGQIYIIPCFDIFYCDRVVRTRKENAGIVIILRGKYAGQYDGDFRDDDEIELLTIEELMGCSK